MIGYFSYSTSRRGLNRKKRKKLIWITFGFIFFVFLLDRFYPPQRAGILFGETTNLRPVVRFESREIDMDNNFNNEAEGEVKMGGLTHHFVIRGFLLGIVCTYIFNRCAELIIVLMISEFLVLFSMYTKGWIVVHWKVLSTMFIHLLHPGKLFSLLMSNFFGIVAFCLGIYCGQIVSAFLERPKKLRNA